MSSPDRTRTNARGIPGLLKRALQPLRRRRRRDREAIEPFAYGESAEMGEINPQEVADALDSAARWRQDPTAFYELVNRMGVSAVYRSARPAPVATPSPNWSPSSNRSRRLAWIRR